MGTLSLIARIGALALLGALSCACAGGPKLPSLPQASVSAGASGGSAASLPVELGKLQLASAEVYSRIARGANACWFGPRGRLAKTHILHADAAPSMNGGAVDVVVHERAIDQPKPWGYKAFRVQLSESPGLDGTPGAGGTTIAVENARIGEAEAARMRAEVFQWAGGTEGCRADPALDKPPEPPVAAAAVAPATAKTPPANAAPAKAAQTTAPAKKAAAKATTTAAGTPEPSRE